MGGVVGSLSRIPGSADHYLIAFTHLQTIHCCKLDIDTAHGAELRALSNSILNVKSLASPYGIACISPDKFVATSTFTNELVQYNIVDTNGVAVTDLVHQVLMRDYKVTLAQDFPSTGWDEPTGVYLSPDRSRLYVSNFNSQSIECVELKTNERTVLYKPQDGIGIGPTLGEPGRIYPSADNRYLFVTDQALNCVLCLDMRRSVMSIVAGDPDAKGGHENGMGCDARFTKPRGIICTHARDTLYVLDSHSLRRITLYDPIDLQIGLLRIPRTAHHIPEHVRHSPLQRFVGDAIFDRHLIREILRFVQ
jgi:DNA-binding beta-propeller fold protein YncE